LRYRRRRLLVSLAFILTAIAAIALQVRRLERRRAEPRRGEGDLDAGSDASVT
jgi:flagellar biogenesis protein FliO